MKLVESTHYIIFHLFPRIPPRLFSISLQHIILNSILFLTYFHSFFLFHSPYLSSLYRMGPKGALENLFAIYSSFSYAISTYITICKTF